MAKRLSGTITDLGPCRRSRGDNRYEFILIRDARGNERRLKGMSVAESVDDAMSWGDPLVLYCSPFWGYIYGVRVLGKEGRFESWAARWYTPWLAIGMIFGGLATSVFLFPILVAIAGICALIVAIDARIARARFRGDARQGASVP